MGLQDGKGRTADGINSSCHPWRVLWGPAAAASTAMGVHSTGGSGDGLVGL